MANPDHLAGLALATKGRAMGGLIAADAGQSVPEVHRDTPVIRVAHHFPQRPVLDQLTVFTAELELVAVVINRPGSIGTHQNAKLDLANQLVERSAARLKVDVGHAID